MREKLNLWSFFLSIICLVSYLTVYSWAELYRLIGEISDPDAVNIVYVLSLITLILGIIGLTGKKNLKSVSRGIVTILITFSITGLLSFLMWIQQSFLF
ncbi:MULTISPECIES: hypothetical protein [unclassified Paenibacillus]|uniref:hypothetical protein n=1 Tax=unclassified Paenibacillus TaxID=185978 RepID=UPI00135C90FA|nr:hypothetical protein [Paenibacillus sp. An7]